MILRQVVVEYRVHALDINAAGCHVGGDQNGTSAAFEAVHHLCPLKLLHVAVKPCRRKATQTEGFGQFVYHFLGVTEDHCRLRLFRQQQQLESIGLTSHGHADRKLCNRIYCPVGTLNLHQHRLFLILLGNCQNCRRHGGGEQHSLAFLRNLCQHRFDVLAEAHVQHFIGFVQHDRFQVVQLQGTAAEVVKDTSGSADHQIGTVFQLVDLAFHAGTAVDCHRLHLLLKAGKLTDLVACLHCQFPCGTEDQGTDTAAFLLRQLSHLFQNRDTERRGFSGTGIGLADHIPALQQQRDRLFLNFSHFGKIQLCHSFQQRCG